MPRKATEGKEIATDLDNHTVAMYEKVKEGKRALP